MSDLFAGLDLNVVGRNSAPLTAHVIRDLDRGDIEGLMEEGQTQPQRIKKLRERHHALAKALVDGIPEGEAGIICGYTPSRVSILKSDPTFKELMEFYRTSKHDRYIELHDKIARLGEDAVDEITERLEEAPEDISIGQLIELSKMTLDRSGHGPSTTSNVNVKVGLADKLAAARKRALEHRTNQLREDAGMIDITPEGDTND